MSKIFETEFRDFKDEGGDVTKASTAKIVLLAMADHANDEGEGAYPGLDRMVVKTGLTKQAIIKTYDALKYNGIIVLEGRSKLGTNNYTILAGAFPGRGDDGKPRLLVNPVESEGKPSLPVGVNPVYPNHPLTTIEPPAAAFSDPSWDIQHGKDPSSREDIYRTVAERLEVGLRRNQFPQDLKAQAVMRWINEQEKAGQSLDQFVRWAMRDERAISNSWVYFKTPSAIRRDWPQAFVIAAEKIELL